MKEDIAKTWIEYCRKHIQRQINNINSLRVLNEDGITTNEDRLLMKEHLYIEFKRDLIRAEILEGSDSYKTLMNVINWNATDYPEALKYNTKEAEELLEELIENP